MGKRAIGWLLTALLTGHTAKFAAESGNVPLVQVYLFRVRSQTLRCLFPVGAYPCLLFQSLSARELEQLFLRCEFLLQDLALTL